MSSFMINGKDGKELVVKQVGKSIVVEMPYLTEKIDYSQQVIELSADDFKIFIDKMKKLAEEVWSNIEPKEANSDASDYYEYYDKELDNNGSFSFNMSKGQIEVSQVYQYNSRVFKFNKRKMQSLLYDFEKDLTDI